MFRQWLTGAALACLSALPATAQMGGSPAPAPGYWRCVANSPLASIDMQYQVGPGGQLAGQGTIVYSGTWQTYNVSGPGRWGALPPDQDSNEWLFQFQLQPQNHAVFSVYARPTNDPNYLNNVFYNPQSGQTTETSCQKIG
ncbi:hypothetical protein [Ponticaulis profundi]|uniref:Secreted protein n=1 Tax=Ponticaulis profundi TaxID=2665222 RepID=A0ABW1SBJ0_9PROT